MMNELSSITKWIIKKGRVDIWLSYFIPSTQVVACIVIILAVAQPVYAKVFKILSGDFAALINAINTANSNVQQNTINLAAGTYSLTAVDNNTDGANGLQSITGKISIKGAGANTTVTEGMKVRPHFVTFTLPLRES